MCQIWIASATGCKDLSKKEIYTSKRSSDITDAMSIFFTVYGLISQDSGQYPHDSDHDVLTIMPSLSYLTINSNCLVICVYICSSWVSSGTPMAARRPACRPRHLPQEWPSLACLSTARLFLTPRRDTTSANLTPMTSASLTPMIFMRSPGPSTRVGVSITPRLQSVCLVCLSFSRALSYCVCVELCYNSSVFVFGAGPEYQEVEVHLLREKTGFGFRILGGDEAVQAVSPDARDKARMGRAGAHTHVYTNTHTSSQVK